MPGKMINGRPKKDYITVAQAGERFHIKVGEFRTVCTAYDIKVHYFRTSPSDTSETAFVLIDDVNKLDHDEVMSLFLGDDDDREIIDGMPKIILYWYKIRDNPTEKNIKQLFNLLQESHNNLRETLYITYPIEMCELIYKYNLIERSGYELPPMSYVATERNKSHGVHHSRRPEFFTTLGDLTKLVGRGK